MPALLYQMCDIVSGMVESIIYQLGKMEHKDGGWIGETEEKPPQSLPVSYILEKNQHNSIQFNILFFPL